MTAELPMTADQHHHQNIIEKSFGAKIKSVRGVVGVCEMKSSVATTTNKREKFFSLGKCFSSFSQFHREFQCDDM